MNAEVGRDSTLGAWLSDAVSGYWIGIWLSDAVSGWWSLPSSWVQGLKVMCMSADLVFRLFAWKVYGRSAKY